MGSSRESPRESVRSIVTEKVVVAGVMAGVGYLVLQLLRATSEKPQPVVTHKPSKRVFGTIDNFRAEMRKTGFPWEPS